MIPTPSVGQVAHYVSEGSPVLPGGTQKYPRRCRAATITEVGAWITTNTDTSDDGLFRVVRQEWNPTAVGLTVTNPTGLFFTTGVPHDPGYAETADPAMCTGLRHDGGSWHWPTRVE